MPWTGRAVFVRIAGENRVFVRIAGENRVFARKIVCVSGGGQGVLWVPRLGEKPGVSGPLL